MGLHKPQKEKKKSLLEQKTFCATWQLRARYSLKHLKFPEQRGLSFVEKTKICENYFESSF